MIWGFSDRAIAETLKTMALSIGKGPNAVPDSLRDNGSRIFVVSLPEALDPLSKNGGTDLTPSSGTAKLLKKDLSTDALALRKSGNSEEDYTVPIFNLSGHSIPETPEEPKPEDLHLAIQDSFGALYLLPEVSELFGILAESWDPGDTEPKTITLDEGFERSEDFGPFQAYPAPTLAEGLSTGTAVTCRYVKAVGKWFFFRPSEGGGKVLHVSGTALAVDAGTGPDHVITRFSEPVFYSEMAAGESVDGLSITAISQSQTATGSDTANVWVQFPSSFSTLDESVYWWRRESRLTSLVGAIYQTGSSGAYSISPTDYYGKVISDGTYYYYPKYRTINGERYWEGAGLGISLRYIYYTSKDGAPGWAMGNTLGKWLTSSDTEPFYSDADGYNAGFYEPLSYLMNQESMTYTKPAWTSSSQFGIYSANADAATLFPAVPSIQFGCGRWSFPDGADPYYGGPSYFTHVCDGTAKQWTGSYYIKAFQIKFRGINYAGENGDNYYYLGDRTSIHGFYKSTSAPSTSSSVTFSYTPGTHPLKGVLSYVSTSSGMETWSMKLSSGAVAVYSCAENATSMTMDSITSGDYFFRTITKSGNCWVATGVDGTIGALTFDGATLSKESGNDFIFDHDITLTFDQYVQGSEKKKIWICSPGVIS